MNTFENIKKLREARGLSQTDLACKVGYKDRSSIAKIEAGDINLTQSKIAAFADALGVTPAELMGIADVRGNENGEYNRRREPYNTVPLLGTIACGEPILAEQNFDEYITLPDNVKADFALRCKGDSMINARIFDGDIVYIRQQPTVENGEIAAVLIDDEATLKRVHIYSDHAILAPENPAYKPLLYWGADMANMRILGKAIAFTSMIP